MKVTYLGLAAALLVTGCAADREARNQFKDSNADADALHHLHEVASDASVDAPIVKSARVYIGGNRAPDPHGDPLPERLEARDGFSFHETRAFSLASLKALITKRTGLPIDLQDGLLTAEAQPHAPTAVAAHDPTIDTIDGLVGTGGGLGGTGPAKQILPDYDGPLSGFLDRVLPQYGVDYESRGNRLFWGREFIRFYPIAEFNSRMSITAGLSGSTNGSPGGGSAPSGSATPTANQGGQSGSPQGGAQQGLSSTSTTSFDSWGELMKSLEGYTGDASKLYPEPSNGGIRAKCSLYCHGLLQAAIDEHNRTAGRSILVTVAVLAVQRTGTDNYGFSPNVLYKNLPTGYSLSVLAQAAAVNTASGGAITGGIINPPAGTTASKYDGTSIAVQAISSDEHAVVTMQKFELLGNGRPFAVRDALDYSYVTTSTNSLNSAIAQNYASLAMQVIGDQLQIIPRLQPDGYIRMQIALSRTSIQSYTDPSLGPGITSHVPQVKDNTSSPQEFTVHDGATLIFSDVASDNTDSTHSGAGPTWNPIFGGSASANIARTKLILVVSAREWHPGDDGLSPPPTNGGKHG